MNVLTFVSQKGGSGKTTLAVSCAVAAEQKGHKVLLVDMDPQGTAEQWFLTRENETPQVIKLTASDLEKALTAAPKQGYDLVIIDTPGRDDIALTAAIRRADLCIIPCRPTPPDMRSTPPTVETIRRLNREAAFVLSQTPPRSYRNREAEAGLKILAPVAPYRTVQRNAYQDALGAGLGVTEYEPTGQAADEVRKLWKWIESKLRKVTNGKTEANKS